MSTPSRIAQLELYVAWWQQNLDRANENRDRLLHFQQIGIRMTDDSGADLLGDRIAMEDQAARSYHRGLTYAQSMLGRAQAGQDV